MTDVYSRAKSAVDSLFAATDLRPTLGIILGSGLGGFATQVDNALRIPYAEIPHFPRSTVEGHSGHLVLGTIAGIPVAVMQGRVHAYEGYPLSEVTFPTRVLGLFGCKALIVTNAAGGINPSYQQGSLIAISDHINLTGSNAALGPNEPRFATTPGTGQRFFDMSAAYSPRLRRLAIRRSFPPGLPTRRRSLPRRPRPQLRNPRRNPRLPHPRRRSRGHVNRPRDHRRTPHGSRSPRHLPRHQHGSRSSRRRTKRS